MEYDGDPLEPSHGGNPRCFGVSFRVRSPWMIKKSWVISLAIFWDHEPKKKWGIEGGGMGFSQTELSSYNML